MTFDAESIFEARKSEADPKIFSLFQDQTCETIICALPQYFNALAKSSDEPEDFVKRVFSKYSRTDAIYTGAPTGHRTDIEYHPKNGLISLTFREHVNTRDIVDNGPQKFIEKLSAYILENTKKDREQKAKLFGVAL